MIVGERCNEMTDVLDGLSQLEDARMGGKLIDRTVVIADSTSRWAEALREFANRNGDLPAEEGCPANLASEQGGIL